MLTYNIMSNGDEMLKASVGTLYKVKTIDELTKKVVEIKKEIRERGINIRGYGKGLLKNMTSKKVSTGITIHSGWSDQEIVFANYGVGLQNSYNTNATSLAELEWLNFIKTCEELKVKEIELSKYLKPEKEKILKRFLKNIEKLNIDREPQSIKLEKDIRYVNRNMLSARGGEDADMWGEDNNINTSLERMTKKAKLQDVEYYENKLSFSDTQGDKVRISLNNPQLEDALILEQIFDETKELLEKEIARLEIERHNYNSFINELKQDFSNELLIMELAK